MERLAQMRQRERVVLRPIEVGDGVNVALVMPFQPADSPARFVVAIIHLQPIPQQLNDAMTTMLNRSVDDVNRASATAAQQAKDRLTTQPKGGPWPAFEAARRCGQARNTPRCDGLSRRPDRRALSRDLYLLADDATLAKLLDDVGKRLAKVSSNDRSDDALAWQLDLSSLAFLSQTLSDGHLPPTLAAVLTDYAGEAGRHPGSMEEISKGLANRDDLERRLIAENMIYLEDSSPAARVRASDWLASRGKVLAGYDPLSTPRQRRDALEKRSHRPPRPQRIESNERMLSAAGTKHLN